MKKMLLLNALLLVAGFAFSQKIRLNGYGAYIFDDHYGSTYDSYNYYEGTIKEGGQWGVGIEYMIAPDYGVELIYQHETTKAPTIYQNGVTVSAKSEDFDLNLNYIMLGANRYKLLPSGKVEGFGGLYAGVNIMDVESPSTHNTASATKFAWMARLGANIWATPKIGIKLLAQIESVAQGVGGGFYFGTGGAGAGLSTYSTIYQFGLGGGLTVKLGK